MMYFLLLWSLVLIAYGAIILVKPRTHIELGMRVTKNSRNRAASSSYSERTRLLLIRLVGFFALGMGVFTFIATIRVIIR